MICEICGKRFKGEGIEVYVDGAQLRVCPRCGKFGSRVEPQREKRKSGPVTKKRSHPSRKKRDTFTVVPDYAQIIRKAREERDLSQKELARKINEKESIIHRLETESMTPSHKLTKKLEKSLQITIRDTVSEIKPQKTLTDSKNLTIGDIIKIKKK